VPFISYWKGKIKPMVSDALVCQVDLLSSLSSLVGSQIKGADSQDLWDVLAGKTNLGRKELVIEATTRTALRKGDWMMIPPYKGQAVNTFVNIELGNANSYQLYNLKADIGQKNNLAESNKDKLDEMITAFEAIRGKDYSETQKLELK